MHYPDDPSPEHMDSAREFFFALRYLLPCPGCRVGIAKMVDAPEFEAALANQQALFTWTVQAHNAVNARTGKREMTVEEVLLEDHARYVKHFHMSRVPGPFLDLHARACAASPYTLVAWNAVLCVLLLIVALGIVRVISRRRGRSLNTC